MTPLKNWAIVSFILGFITLGVAAMIGVPAVSEWMRAEREIKSIERGIEGIERSGSTFLGFSIPSMRTLEEDFRQEKATAQLITFFALLLGIGGLCSVVNGVRLNRADALLGETFLRCPFCFSDKVVFDVKLGTFEDKIICRDCHALWKFHLNILSMSLTRLWLEDYGTALREEEKNAVPNTDIPEQWLEWARQRFRQGQTSIPSSFPRQEQIIFCRFCGHRNLPDANFCSACGKKL